MGLNSRPPRTNLANYQDRILRKLGLRNAGPELSQLGHAAGSGLESALVRRSLLNVHKWLLGRTVYTIVIHTHSVRTKLLSFNYDNRHVRDVTGCINPTFVINLTDRRNLSSFYYQFSFTARIFFCIKSGTCQSRKKPKKFKVNFRKWHVSKLNLIFLLSRSLTKAPVSRLINNSTPPHKLNSRPSSS